MISLPALPDETVRQIDVRSGTGGRQSFPPKDLSDKLARTGSEVVLASENKDMFLSFERRPRPPWRESNTGILSKERTVVRPEIQ